MGAPWYVIYSYYALFYGTFFKYESKVRRVNSYFGFNYGTMTV